jgi:hypothetical protein
MPVEVAPCLRDQIEKLTCRFFLRAFAFVLKAVMAVEFDFAVSAIGRLVELDQGLLQAIRIDGGHAFVALVKGD